MSFNLTTSNSLPCVLIRSSDFILMKTLSLSLLTDGLQVGNLDMTATEMEVISLKDVVTQPAGSVVREASTPLYTYNGRLYSETTR